MFHELEREALIDRARAKELDNVWLYLVCLSLLITLISLVTYAICFNGKNEHKEEGICNNTFVTMIIMRFSIITTLFFLAKGGNCAKILCVAPLPALSHFQMLAPLLKALAERGHEVTVVSHFPLVNKRENYIDIDLRELNPAFSLDFVPYTLWDDIVDLFAYGAENCKNFTSSEKIRAFLESDKKFDLIIMEGFDSDCYLGFVARYKVPYIVFTAMLIPNWISNWIYNPTEVAYFPDNICRLGGSMSFYDRLQNIGCHLTCRWLNWYQNRRPVLPIIREHFGVNTESLEEIQANVSLIFVNSFHGITGIRPLLPNIKEVGGIHLNPPQDIPKDIKKFLDEATDGAIIMSMGSIVKSHTLNNQIKEEILRVFSKLKQRILWKWEVDFPDPPPNLKTIRWMPQADVLGHPNVKMFIAHGGIHGLYEAINYGVPLVGIPLFGDQQGNLKSLQHRGVAVVIEYENLSEDTLYSAITSILNNESYTINSKKLSNIFHDQPQTPLERALFWTEYVIRHKGAPHFHNSATRLSWFQYLMVDVILTAFLLIVLFAFSCRYSLKLIKFKR